MLPEWAEKYEVQIWLGVILLVIAIAAPWMLTLAMMVFTGVYFYRKGIEDGSFIAPARKTNPRG